MGVYEKQMLISENGYINLAAAIVLQAVKDYRKGLRQKNPGRRLECERFFHSKWFTVLTDIDGGYLIKKLREEKNKNDGKGMSGTGISH